MLCERSRTPRDFRKTAGALAESSMAGGALIGKNFGAAVDRATAQRKPCAVLAAHVDIPSGNLFRRGLLAITEMRRLLVTAKMPRLLVVPKMLGLCGAGAGAYGRENGCAEQPADITRAEHRRRSRPA